MPPDGFIDGDIFDSDPFDPRVIQQFEDQENAKKVTTAAQLDIYIRRRKQAYMAVFSTESCSADDLQFVMLDLAAFCRAYTTTFNKDQKTQDLLEGRRQVFQRIMDYTKLSHDTLFIKHVESVVRGV